MVTGIVVTPDTSRDEDMAPELQQQDEHPARRLQQAEMGEAGFSQPYVQGVLVDAVPGSAVMMGEPEPYAFPGGVVEELIVLNYRMALMRFAWIDVIVTVMAVLVENKAFYGLCLWSGLALLIGPICGLVGARRLKIWLVSVHVAFCPLKPFQYMLIANEFLRLAALVVQLWVTTIIVEFLVALGEVPPERRPQLAEEKEAPVHMVYW